jgi:hypothetical protein
VKESTYQSNMKYNIDTKGLQSDIQQTVMSLMMTGKKYSIRHLFYVDFTAVMKTGA